MQHVVSVMIYPTQDQLNNIAHWTEENLMQLNEQIRNYVIFSRARENFISRLHIDNHTLNQILVTQLIGV